MKAEEPKKKKALNVKKDLRKSLVTDENEDDNINMPFNMMENFELNQPQNNDESYLEVLHRMKDKHMQNLRLIEQMYYGDCEGQQFQPGGPTDGKSFADHDSDHLLSLYQGDLGAFHKTFSAIGTKKEWTGEATKPAPFSFLKKTEAERKSEMGIARRRCLEYLAQVKEREDVELKKTFKANPIPRSTTEPRFQQMRVQWERRRDESRQMNAWMSQEQDDEAFSFVKRNEERMKRRKWQTDPEMIEIEHFHAKPIPWSVKVSLYDQLRKDNEERRKKRIAARAACMLKKSALPQRMAIYERTKGQKKKMLREVAAQQQSVQNQQRKSHDIPDFEKLQAQFQHNLEKARERKSLTKPIGFSFTARPVKPAHRHDQEQTTPKRTLRYKRDPNPPQPTKKFLDAIAYLNTKIEEKKRREQEAAEAAAKLRMDPEKRQLLAERIRAHMVDNTAVLEQRQEESLRQARERDRQLAKETAQRLQDMRERVDQRPLLLEINGSENCPTKRLARQKALLSVKDSLVNAGISDYKKFFDPSELKDLEITDL